MNNKLNKVLWILLLLIGLIPYIITGVIGIEAAINGENGFCADCPDEFGIEAFCGTTLTLLILFLPIYVLAIIIILLAFLKLKGKNSLYIKKIVWITLLVILLFWIALTWAFASFWGRYIIPAIILAIIRLIMLKRKENNERMK